jgi:hypothetical protein
VDRPSLLASGLALLAVYGAVESSILGSRVAREVRCPQLICRYRQSKRWLGTPSQEFDHAGTSSLVYWRNVGRRFYGHQMGEIRSWNKAAQKLFEYSAAEAQQHVP